MPTPPRTGVATGRVAGEYATAIVIRPALEAAQERDPLKRPKKRPKNKAPFSHAVYFAARIKAGLCRECGKPRNKYGYRCDACEKRRREWTRKNYGTKRGPSGLGPRAQRLLAQIAHADRWGLPIEPMLETRQKQKRRSK